MKQYDAMFSRGLALDAIRVAKEEAARYRPQGGSMGLAPTQPQVRPGGDLCIDGVCVGQQPWHVRHRPLLWAGGLAAGFLGLRWLLRRDKLVANPHVRSISKDPTYWGEPFDLGPTSVYTSDKRIREIAGLRTPRFVTHLWEGLPGDAPSLYNLNTSMYYHLAVALGHPTEPPTGDARRVLNSFVRESGSDIANILDIIEAAKVDKKARRRLWMILAFPRLTALVPWQRELFIDRLMATPREQRWRASWLLYEWIGAGNFHRWAGERGAAPDDYDEALERGTEGQYEFSYENLAMIEKALGLSREEFVCRYAPEKNSMWRELQGYVPDKQQLTDLPCESILAFDTKSYLRAYRHLDKDPLMGAADKVVGAIGLQNVFGSTWKHWLTAMVSRGIDNHDATYWLPRDPSSGLAKRLRREALVARTEPDGRKVHVLGRTLDELAIVARAWSRLDDQARSLPWKQLANIAATAEYEDVRDVDFAKEAARWAVGPDEYFNIETRWLQREHTKQGLPDVEASKAPYRLFLVDKNDPRGLFLGYHTSCCQEPGGAGSSCAWFGVEHPDSGFYAVEDTRSGNIVAQAWTWRHGDVIVFDNIEGPALQASNTRKAITHLYEELAHRIVKGAYGKIAEVRIGTTVDRHRHAKNIQWPWPLASKSGSYSIIPPPVSFFIDAPAEDDPYTDASSKQYLVARYSDDRPRYFSGQRFKGAFGAIALKAIQNGDDEYIEMAADVVHDFGIPYSVDCEVTSEEAGDEAGVSLDTHFSCDFAIGGEVVETWKPCVHTEYTDESLDQVEQRECDNGSDEPSSEAAAFLDHIEDSWDVKGSCFDTAKAPHVPKRTPSGKYAVVYDDENYIVGEYKNDSDAWTVADMMNTFGSYFLVYYKLDNPEDDDEHGKDSILYGWDRL